jgi:hypothetical protein
LGCTHEQGKHKSFTFSDFKSNVTSALKFYPD